MLGKFIVIEGLEGAGKTTAKEAIIEVLKRLDIHDILLTREPGGTPLAEKLRDLIKSETEEMITPKAELLMLYAARIQLVENVLQPALKAGKWVIGDRHDLSSQAYQGGGRQLDSRLLASLKKQILGDFKPDLTLYLDISPEVGLARARGRGELDRIEKQNMAFFDRTRAHYLALVKQDPNAVVIKAEQPLVQVTQDIQHAVERFVLRQKEN